MYLYLDVLQYLSLYLHSFISFPQLCSPLFSSVQSLSPVQLFATPWITARQASLSITNSRSSLRITSIESVMPSSHLILSHPLLLLPPIPPSMRVFSSESTLRMRWPKYWSFSFSIIDCKRELPSSQMPDIVKVLCILNLFSCGKGQFYFCWSIFCERAILSEVR